MTDIGGFKGEYDIVILMIRATDSFNIVFYFYPYVLQEWSFATSMLDQTDGWDYIRRQISIAKKNSILESWFLTQINP